MTRTVRLPPGITSISLVDALMQDQPVLTSHSEFRRFDVQGALKVDGEPVAITKKYYLEPGKYEVQVGKRITLTIIVEASSP